MIVLLQLKMGESPIGGGGGGEGGGGGGGGGVGGGGTMDQNATLR
jgi:hypothetical protein